MISKLLFILLFTFLLFCSIISKRKFGFWANHYVLTNLWWLFTLFASIFFNNYVKPVSDEIYIIFFIGLISFNSTILTAKIKKIPNNLPLEYYSIKRRRIIELIVLIAIVPIAYENIQSLLSGVELWRINDAYWRDETKRQDYWSLFYTENIIEPLSTILLATCFFKSYINGNKISVLITVVIGISLAFLNMIVTGGGRTGLMTLVFVLILSFLASTVLKGREIMVNISLKGVVLIGFLAFLGVKFSSEGRGQDEGIFNVLIDRFTLAPALFEGWYKGTDICKGYSLGTSMFETPLSILFYPLKFIGIGISERISSIEQQSMFAPALGQGSNAAVTAYLYYMRDFGYFGVVLGPYIVAKIYNYLWKICRDNVFMLVFYFTGICLTCFETIYPFRRGFIFVIIFAFLYKKFITIK